MNAIKNIMTLGLISLAMTGCSEDVMDRINQDTSHTNGVDGKFIMTDVITSTAFNSVGGDFNTYISSYVEYEVGIDNQLYNAEVRVSEPSASSTFENQWTNAYSTLKAVRIVIDQCQEGQRDADNYVTRGIAKVMEAYNGALLADLFGDIPYSQAALIDENGSPLYRNPKIDKQEDVYASVLQTLDEAIEDLNMSDRSPIGNYDLLYGGDAQKWIKFAYGLKARYTMHLVERSADQNAALKQVVEYAEKSFSSPEEQAAFAVYDGAQNLNPLFAFFNSRMALAASASLVEKLVDRNDPRLERVLFSPANKEGIRSQITGADDPNLVTAPNGKPEQNMQKYCLSAYMFANTASTMLMSYHELQFLKAEALYRLNPGNTEVAETLKKAVVAGLLNAESSALSAIKYLGSEVVVTAPAITEESASVYFDKQILPVLSNKDKALAEIMVQKYLAFWGASGETIESYNDIRRYKALGKDFVTLKNEKKFPLRCPYGNSDVVSNPEVKAAYGDGQYVYTENVWWAGGSR